MSLFPYLLSAAAIVAVVFLIGIFVVRNRARRTRSVGRQIEGGPTQLRFTCAGCSVQFTHSRRTSSAWRQGSRKFLCKACHTKRRGAGG